MLVYHTRSNITPIRYFAFPLIDMQQTWQPKTKRHSNYDATHVIKHFFHLFGNWNWPDPVALIEINPSDRNVQKQIQQLERNAAMTSWNKYKDENKSERFQVYCYY